MPARYWVPLIGLQEPVAVEHLHAALSGWFDDVPDLFLPGNGARHSQESLLGEAHDRVVKPYTISPVSVDRGTWGVEIATINEAADRVLIDVACAGAPIRLGRHLVTSAAPHRLSEVAWEQLSDYEGETGWKIDFLTPLIVRTGSRSSPFPTPAAVLRSPASVWDWYSPLAPLELPREQHSSIWVSRIDGRTDMVSIKGRRYPGFLGTVTYRCTDQVIAPAVSTLFRFAEYSGSGSFRGKGMGVVVAHPF